MQRNHSKQSLQEFISILRSSKSKPSSPGLFDNSDEAFTPDSTAMTQQCHDTRYLSLTIAPNSVSPCTTRSNCSSPRSPDSPVEQKVGFFSSQISEPSVVNNYVALYESLFETSVPTLQKRIKNALFALATKTRMNDEMIDVLSAELNIELIRHPNMLKALARLDSPSNEVDYSYETKSLTAFKFGNHRDAMLVTIITIALRMNEATAEKAKSLLGSLEHMLHIYHDRLPQHSPSSTPSLSRGN